MDIQELEFRARERDAAARRERQEQDDRTSNRDFVQVYPNGWKRLQTLMKTNTASARLWAFLAENIDSQCGAVVVSQEVLAEELDVSIITVKRHTKALEDAGALVRIRIGSGVYAYCLNPEDVWKSWDKNKKVAGFRTKTLVRKSDKENGTVKRKLSMMIKEHHQDEDFPDQSELL